MNTKIYNHLQNFQLEKISNFSLWQSESWKNILEKSHQASEVFYFGNPEKTFFLVEIRSIGAGFFGAFILGVKNFQISEDFENIFIELKKVLQQKKCIFIQFEPLENIEILENFFQKSGHTDAVYKKFLTPFTRIISLEPTEDEIIMNMPQKGRYAVRNAEKKGVQIEIITDFSPKIIDEWMQLLSETTERDNFSHNSREYYEMFLSELGKNVVIVASKLNEKYLAMTILVFSGDSALYYYGASTSDAEGRKLASSYLTLWESMKFSKNSGKKKYDLFGVADPNNPNDPLLGVSQFKQKLGGELTELPQKFLYILSWKYSVFKILQTIKKILKK